MGDGARKCLSYMAPSPSTLPVEQALWTARNLKRQPRITGNCLVSDGSKHVTHSGVPAALKEQHRGWLTAAGLDHQQDDTRHVAQRHRHVGKRNQLMVLGVGNNRDNGGMEHDRLANDTRDPLHAKCIPARPTQ